LGLFSSEATRRAPEGEQMIGGPWGMLPRNSSKKYGRLKRIFPSLNGLQLKNTSNGLTRRFVFYIYFVFEIYSF
jgi:hypothetical protein